jgi:DnaK suppressor protein
MSQDRTRLQKEKLRKEREQTLSDLERLREALKTEVDPNADEGDPDLVEREKVMALVKTLERKLESLDYALRQAQEGTYGICERCGQPIDPARLEAVPETTLCVKCKSIVERQRARVGTTASNKF